MPVSGRKVLLQRSFNRFNLQYRQAGEQSTEQDHIGHAFIPEFFGNFIGRDLSHT